MLRGDDSRWARRVAERREEGAMIDTGVRAVKWITREKARVARNDHENMARQLPVYDAVHAYRRSRST